MPFVANDGLQIAYDVTGRGAGPGYLFAQRKVGWARMGYVDALSTQGKVLVVDPRGFGDSSRCRSETDYSLDAFCDDLLAAADAAGLDRFFAWGYSNTAALAVALSHRTDRCIGVACCGMDPLIDFTVFSAHLDAEVREAGEGEYLPEGGFDWRAARAFYRDYSARQPGVADVGRPAVLIHGDADELVCESVIRNRDRLEQFGYDIRPLGGLDHQTCVEASARVIETALTSLGGARG